MKEREREKERWKSRRDREEISFKLHDSEAGHFYVTKARQVRNMTIHKKY